MQTSYQMPWSARTYWNIRGQVRDHEAVLLEGILQDYGK